MIQSNNFVQTRSPNARMLRDITNTAPQNPEKFKIVDNSSFQFHKYTDIFGTTIEYTYYAGATENAIVREIYSNKEVLDYTLQNGIKQGSATYRTQFAVEEFIFVNGVKHGRATISSFNGRAYFLYQNGIVQGEMTKIFANGDVLKSNNVNGVEQGLATMSFSNGDTLFFMLVDGMARGEGVHTYPDGRMAKVFFDANSAGVLDDRPASPEIDENVDRFFA